ncbi:MAG: hypothetical protein IT160_07980, partial [Bryobacterales bacterium]|nr:hypothetical protein [Bryobacterales bacterium]
MRKYLLPALVLVPCLLPAAGYITINGNPRFPIGNYELPKDDAGLKEMAAAGINLFHCGSKGDLDRVAAVGAKGWVSLPMQVGGADAKLRQRILELKDHPALAA